MTRLLSLFVLLLLLPAASAMAGDLPQVLQPNATVYSASEVAALTQAIATLTEALNDYDMASRRYFSASDWRSRDFAMYTAGVLSEKGYNTLLVSADGWPDGTHTWVLVGISLGTKTVWVPVEASPEASHNQLVLGHIARVSPSGSLAYEERYMSFESVAALPPNKAPIARIRRPSPPIEVHKGLRFMALGSSDPDGEVVLYIWDFGDGETTITTKPSVSHRFDDQARYTTSLTVIDNRGKAATSSVDLAVVRLQEPQTQDRPSGGCGCGG